MVSSACTACRPFRDGALHFGQGYSADSRRGNEPSGEKLIRGVPSVPRRAGVDFGFEHDDLGLTGSDIGRKLNAKLAIVGM